MVSVIKRLLKKYFTNFSYFYSHLRYRIFVVLVMSILVGMMDGFGLAMFLPMLEIVADQESTASAVKMGNLSFIVDFIAYLGFPMSLGVILFTLLVFFSTKGVFLLIGAYLNVVYLQFFVRNIRVRNIDALADFNYKQFVLADAGRIQNTMSGEVGRVSNAYKSYLLMLQQSVMILTYSFLALLSNPQFAILVAIGGALTNIIFKRLFIKTKILSKQLTLSSHNFQGLLIQQVAFFKYLKASGLIKLYAGKLKERVIEIESSQKRIGIISAIMTGVREPILIGVIVLVILVQVKLMEGSLGLIILSILFFYRALQAVMAFQNAYNTFLSLSGSLENLKEFTRELAQGRQKTGNRKLESFKDTIRLEDVSFRFSREDILKDINLELRRYETLALVGESGSGKTTLMNIMSGLLEPSKGKIYADGIDFRNLDLTTFQKRIGYITQDPAIFDDTVFNNVTFWAKPDKNNLERFYVALEKASIREFVEEQAEKENARLGNNGVNLSGGQKQRIAIARELFKEVEFLFMDEATSALDSETEKVIQENIDRLKGKYTIVIIAHRLSTIKNVDRVVVLKNGTIDKIGNYSELMHDSDSFRRMVELQEL